MAATTDDTDESLALRALAARTRFHRRELAALRGEASGPHAREDLAVLRRRADALREKNPALRALLEECITREHLTAPTAAWLAAWRKEPLRARAEVLRDPVTLPALLVAEPNRARRQALLAAAEARALELRAEARKPVDAWRDAASPENGGVERLGLGSESLWRASCEALLAATEALFLELDGWVRSKHEGLGREPYSLELLARLLSLPRASAAVPAADREGTASRWVERVGMGSALRRVRDRMDPAGEGARAPSAWVDGETGIVELFGTPTRGASGARSTGAALGRGLFWAAGAESGEALLGVDRLGSLTTEALAWCLWSEPVFLVREAGVDRGSREGPLLELLWETVLRARVDAALGLYELAVLERSGGMVEVFRDGLLRAVGLVVAPAWAVHAAAACASQPRGAAVLALLAQTQCADALRERFDVDWYRNPRTGEALSRELTRWRRLGVAADLQPAEKDTVEALCSRAAVKLRERLGDALRELSRG